MRGALIGDLAATDMRPRPLANSTLALVRRAKLPNQSLLAFEPIVIVSFNAVQRTSGFLRWINVSGSRTSELVSCPNSTLTELRSTERTVA